MFQLSGRIRLTTPGDRTKIRGVRVDESSTTDAMSKTGGSTNLKFQINSQFYNQKYIRLPCTPPGDYKRRINRRGMRKGLTIVGGGRGEKQCYYAEGISWLEK